LAKKEIERTNREPQNQFLALKKEMSISISLRSDDNWQKKKKHVCKNSAEN
jgi:hypothetical protein